MVRSCLVVAVAVGCLLESAACQAQLSEPAAFAATLADNYRVLVNLTYRTASNTDLKLDVYMPDPPYGPPPKKSPTVLYFHGGGWVRGSKELAITSIMPYIAWGWSVVNVEYREAHIAPAPAAVEDCRCALRWVVRNAKKYRFDPDRIIVAGSSAGGHLALTTGMLPPSAGFDYGCPDEEAEAVTPEDQAPKRYKVAAIVSFYGITDVADLLEGANAKSYAIEWLGSLPNREDLAKRVSPINYIGAHTPPVLTIHGDLDPMVPYSQAVRLHEALDRAKVPNQLLTIRGGKHGRFTDEQNKKIYSTILEFLKAHGVTRPTAPAKESAAPQGTPSPAAAQPLG